MTVNFKVLGQPQGKARPRFSKGHIYTPKETKEYEKKVRNAYIPASGSYSFGDRAVSVSITAYFKRAKTNKRRFMTSKPDIDNLIKAVLDGLNGTAFNDDRQVVNLSALKLYCDREGDMPYVEVEITDGAEPALPILVSKSF